MDDKQIDLDRRDYTAEPVKGEPIFGNGWPIGFATGVAILIGAYLFDSSPVMKFAGAIHGVVITTLVLTVAGR